jgi:hypothetical protein
MKRPRLASLAALLAAPLLLVPLAKLQADTGTYRIVSYMVALTPHSDGTVAIRYYQKWLVTGGHIPWITIGTPNSDFDISSHGGAVRQATSASEGGWSGVRLDLNNDFQPGQTFEASVSIVQRRLLYADKQLYGLDFTPGWYDRAPIDTLRVGIEFFAKLDSVKVDPEPTLISGDEMSWTRYGLIPGQHFTVHVSFPVGLFPGGIAQGNLRSGPGGSSALSAVPFIFIAVFIFSVIVIASRKRRYTGGRIFYGGFWGGGVGGAGGGRAGGGRSGSGGGGFGGASVSCACACVSCACACACAGGGGAGCSRKLEHICPECRRKPQ